jgi:hypothetical protein
MYQYDPDVLQSIRLGKAAKEAEDKANTCLADQSGRLFYGDVPLFMELCGGHVLWLMMNESQLSVYALCRRPSRGRPSSTGMWADTVGEMVCGPLR